MELITSLRRQKVTAPAILLVSELSDALGARGRGGYSDY